MRPFVGELFAALLAMTAVIYEFALAQSSATLLGNDVVCYCTTIGVYLAAGGLGAWLSMRRPRRDHIKKLARIQTLLALVGGGSVLLLFWAASSVPLSVLALLALFAVGFVGLLSGAELPLLIAACPGTAEHRLVAANLAGACAGSFLFSLGLFPVLGLFGTSLLSGLASAALALALRRSRLAWACLFLLAAALIWTTPLEQSLLRLYVGG